MVQRDIFTYECVVQGSDGITDKLSIDCFYSPTKGGADLACEVAAAMESLAAGYDGKGSPKIKHVPISGIWRAVNGRRLEDKAHATSEIDGSGEVAPPVA